MANTSTLKKLANAVPGRARVMLVLTSVVVIGSVLMFVSMSDNKDKLDSVNNGSGSVGTPSAPSQSQIDSKGQGAKNKLGEDSSISQIENKEHEKRLKKVIDGDGGVHIPGDLIDPSKVLSKPANKNSNGGTGNKAQVEGTDDSEDLERIIREKKEKEDAKRLAAKIANSKKGSKKKSSAREFDEAKFIEQELASALVTSENLGAAITATAESQNSISPFTVSVHKSSTSNSNDRNSQEKQTAASRYLSKAGQADKPDFNVDDYKPSGEIELPVGEKINIGSRYLAILETPINSDEPGPVTAIIIEPGPLEGVRFIGDFARSGEKVFIQWSAFSKNDIDYSVSAVSVDPETESTLLADDVDTHFMERWGAFALASIVEGFSEGISNSTVTQNQDGSTVTTTDSVPDSDDLAKKAIGKVGQRSASILQQRLGTPPTVKVFGQREIGIMFLQGLRLQN